MREIVLDKGVVDEVQVLNLYRDISSIVKALVRALDELPLDMAEDNIYYSLVTSDLGGKQLDQEELVLSLLEFNRICTGKGDEFNALPTAKWRYLHDTPEYQAVEKIVECPCGSGRKYKQCCGK